MDHASDFECLAHFLQVTHILYMHSASAASKVIANPNANPNPKPQSC